MLKQQFLMAWKIKFISDNGLFKYAYGNNQQTRTKPEAALQKPLSLIYLLIKYLTNYFILRSVRRRSTQKVGDTSSIFFYLLCFTGLGHNQFKSYSNFAEVVDFAYWWRGIGKGLFMQSANEACHNMPIPAVGCSTETVVIC